MKNSRNAFRPTVPVHGDDFFGRVEELRAISQRLINGQSVLILGERRIGKTSILTHLHQDLSILEGVPRMWHEDDPSLSNIIEALSINLPKSLKLRAHSTTDSNRHHRLLKGLSLSDRKLLVYINDLDGLLYAANEESDQVQGFLRLLIDRGHTIACATSYRNLDHFAGDPANPPLFNVFFPITLRGFTYDEAGHFLRTVSDRSGDLLQEEECAFLIELAGLVPHHLQLVGFELFSSGEFVGSFGGKRLELLTKSIDRFVESRRDVWGYQIHNLPEEQAAQLAHAAAASESLDDHASGYLVERGILDHGDEQFKTMGTVFGEFVRHFPSFEVGDSPSRLQSLFGRLSETAIKSVVEGAIKAYFH